MILAIGLFVVTLVAVFFLGRWSVLHAQAAVKMELDLIKLTQLAETPTNQALIQTHRARNIHKYVPPAPSGNANPQFRAAWAQSELDAVKETYEVKEDDTDGAE